MDAAHGAARSKKPSLGTQYRRLAARCGKQKALGAIGQSMLVIAYSILTRRRPYRDLGPNYFAAQGRQHVEQRLVRQLTRLGYEVELKPIDKAA